MSYIGKQPIRTALTSSDIEDGVITAAKIEDGAVVAAEIASNAVTTAKINADAVTAAKIADDAVGTDQIAGDAAISTSGAITTTGAFTSIGIDDNSDAVAMTITDAEKIGIGETAPLGKLHVKSGDSGVSSPDITELVVETSGSGGMSLLGATDGQVEIAFGDSGDANIGRIAYNNNGNYLATVVNASEATRIHSNGVLSAANGVALGVGTANTASNVLSDYEEGTWTPTYVPESNSFTSVTYANATIGDYTKIGNTVYFTFYIQTNAITVGSASGYVGIGGLPFTPNGGTVSNGGGTVINRAYFAGDAPAYGVTSSDKIYLYYNTGSTANDILLNVTDLGTGGTDNVFQMMGTYLTDS